MDSVCEKRWKEADLEGGFRQLSMRPPTTRAIVRTIPEWFPGIFDFLIGFAFVHLILGAGVYVLLGRIFLYGVPFILAGIYLVGDFRLDHLRVWVRYYWVLKL